ncbi:hypothetical protein EGI16_10095 [Chryseobacterium sp. G0240]|uniref:hypothetical protein n=1 Tax=Chryseobacterium sp. G0240 TaxID=2487066 RepID=UPI000F454A13|nr:hypothetical protein [Chryseobacterium sp. G0240]ROI04141.1 hypothetical protein EGI16_10095 [Chryseobacterium sp. G0240]
MDRVNHDGENASPETQTQNTAQDNDKMKTANSQKMDDKRAENEEKDKTEEGLLLAIDGAKIKFNAHMGTFKVLNNVPTTQDKLTGTVVEKQILNFIFDDGFQMISLTDWQDFGTAKVQENYVLLKKSTLPGTGKMPGNVPPETGKIEFVTSGQVNVPESIDAKGAPVPEEKEKVNGYFYNYNGTFEGQVIGQKIGTNNDVYACEGRGSEKDVYLKIKKLTTKHEQFIRDASTTYGESSAAYNVIDKLEFFAIASVHKRNKKAYGVNSDFAKKFRSLKDSERNNNEAMRHSIAAEINALLKGHDYSNGAKQWDGAEQTNLPKDSDSSSNGRFMFKVNVMGWDILDEHYISWQAAIKSKFGDKFFNVPQKKYAVSNYGGMKNKDKIRLQSVAQYALTMFWKEVDIKKPEEK